MRVKICGLMHPEHIAAAVESGADAIGLVLAPSVRQVSVDRAARLLEGVPDDVERFAVFRMPDPDLVRAIASLPFTVLQGEAGYVGPVPEGWRYMSTYRNDADVLDRVGEAPVSSAWTQGLVLLDGPGEAGAGVAGDWERARAVARSVPLMLAGGLSIDNVAEALSAVQPVGVDVSSGVERSRGVKDAEKHRNPPVST